MDEEKRKLTHHADLEIGTIKRQRPRETCETYGGDGKKMDYILSTGN